MQCNSSLVFRNKLFVITFVLCYIFLSLRVVSSVRTEYDVRADDRTGLLAEMCNNDGHFSLARFVVDLSV